MKGIKIPPAVLADLYGNNIVVIEEQAAAKPAGITAEAEGGTKQNEAGNTAIKDEIEKVDLLGRFNKKVLIIVNEKEYKHCSEADLAFLQKILSAVKLSMDDIGLVNVHGYSNNYFAIATQHPAYYALFFGIEPFTLGLPMRFPAFQVQPWGATTYLYSPALSKLNGDAPQQVDLKKELWNALKRMFLETPYPR